MGKWLLVGLVCIILLSGCAAGQNPYKDAPRDEAEKPAGFWLGLWHGIIVPVAFVVSWFKSSVNIYEVYNTGFGYNFGFVIGAMIIFGGSGGGSTTVVRK
jgi:hypothetical protein